MIVEVWYNPVTDKLWTTRKQKHTTSMLKFWGFRYIGRY